VDKVSFAQLAKVLSPATYQMKSTWYIPKSDYPVS
jgi:hypothetical protein